MPAPVELALASLLPTISFLPPELIALSTSLLAQSRSKASHLRADEEIGRTYACAHIACERLKNRLDLELSPAAPPVKPRVYQKLYGFLDGVLAANPTTPRTAAGGTIKSIPPLPPASSSAVKKTKDGDGSKTAAFDATRPSSDGTPKSTVDVDASTGVPEFAMPLIRYICQACGTTPAAPHVFAAASSVVKEIASRRSRAPPEEESASKRRRRTPRTSGGAETAAATAALQSAGVILSRWPGLLVALYICTVAKMKTLELDDGEIEQIRTRAIAATTAYCVDKKATLPSGLDEQLDGIDRIIKFYKLEAEDCGWLEMEWHQNVPNVDPTGEDVDDLDDDDEMDGELVTPRTKQTKTPLRRKEKYDRSHTDGLDMELGDAGLLPGLGTMFQPAVDWLSDDRRAKYARWKKSILREIAVIEQTA